ncbi:MAG: DNA-formamidopyrimidine glycosylase [candidate division Zixibacteria bacterium]
MPELPEVETVVRGLRAAVLGRTIDSVTVNAPAASISQSESLQKNPFEKNLASRKILGITRRGKNILISLSGGITLWVHLKMTGHFHYLPASQPIGRHDLVVFELKRGSRKLKHTLRFNDYRRFGRLRLFPDDELWQQPALANLGPEPLEMSADQFLSLCQNRSRMIKAALLDQFFIAGIGNIYADETLHLSRIHPMRLTNSISKRKLNELHSHIQQLLQKAIDNMGTSVDSFSGINGKSGQFQNYLLAYGREGEECSFCGSKIVREKIGARSAHFCRRCQRL